MKPFLGIVVLLYASPVTAFAAVDAHVPAPKITVSVIPDGAITLDGRLDETAWQKTHPVSLTQQDPHPGAPTPYHTTVRVLADSQHLYFGFTNIDPHPDKIVVHTLQRDHSQSNDDHITVVLDTFGTGRLGYWFQVNAGGARNDGLTANGSVDSNWNGIWDTAVHRTSHGWTAEIVISTRSLQFREDGKRWGLNLQRYVPREQLVLRWAGITLNSDVFDLHRAGTLYAPKKLKQGLGLEVQPYLLGRHASEPSAQRRSDAGADIKYHFTPEMEGILTVNPDFAEVEAEQAKVNLSRFSLFFPEKRPFFLEGSNLFTFSQNLNIGDDGNLSTGFVPYFSRRIGLVNGQIVPINEGAKLIGHTGPWSVGALDVVTRTSEAAPATNLAVGRVTYDINNQFRIGTLVTHGDPTGLRNNTFTGIDGLWHTSTLGGNKNLNISGWYAHSAGDLPTGNPDGYGADIEYPNDLWYAQARINVFGDALDPALGFLPRPGTRQYLGIALWRPRPQSGIFDWVRQFQIGGEYIQVDDLDGHPQSKELALIPLRYTTQAGYYFSSVFLSQYESLNAPFQISPGVIIPQGNYHFNRGEVDFQTPQSWPWNIFLSVGGGDFYTGTLRSTTTGVSWTGFEGRLALDLTNETDFVYLPQGNFIQRLDQVQVSYSFTPDLALSSFAQYDTISHHTGINLRMSWIIQPGRELFVVLNHGIQPSVANRTASSPTGDEVIVKLSWDLNW